MATQFNGAGSFLANSAISAFRAVAISANRGVGLNPTTGVPIGFTQQDAADGAFVAVKFFSGPGTQKCAVTGAPITVGDTVYTGANGFVSTVTTNVTIGRSLTSAATNGSIIEFEAITKIA
jgi:hypothetical protein